MPLPGMQIRFKKAAPKCMSVAGTVSGLVFEALLAIGTTRISAKHLSQLKAQLTPAVKKRLRLDAHLAPASIAHIVQKELSDD